MNINNIYMSIVNAKQRQSKYIYILYWNRSMLIFTITLSKVDNFFQTKKNAIVHPIKTTVSSSLNAWSHKARVLLSLSRVRMADAGWPHLETLHTLSTRHFFSLANPWSGRAPWRENWGNAMGMPPRTCGKKVTTHLIENWKYRAWTNGCTYGCRHIGGRERTEPQALGIVHFPGEDVGPVGRNLHGVVPRDERHTVIENAQFAWR